MVRGAQFEVEHQMRLTEVLARVARERVGARRPGPFITVSRQLGSGGAEVARRVGQRLGWSVLDRELVERLAERLELSPKMVELMDETRSNWFRDALLSLVEPRLVEQHAYVAMLGKVMLLAVCEGQVVFVGRGANFLLPRDSGLRVLVVAPRRERVERVRVRDGLDARSAERRLDELDEARADFIRRNFAADVNDPHHYDLVLDSHAFGLDGSVELVCAAFKVREVAGG
jgi:cytidylate kinase